MAISGPMPDGSPTVSASGGISCLAHGRLGSALDDLRLLRAARRRISCSSSSPFLSSSPPSLWNTNWATRSSDTSRRRADADELDAALGLAHGGGAAELGGLDLLGPVRRQLRREHAAEVAHRHVDQALGELPRGLAAGEALRAWPRLRACACRAWRRARSPARRRSPAAACIRSRSAWRRPAAACAARRPARSCAAFARGSARRAAWSQPIWARMNSLKCACVTPAWSRTPASCLAVILFDVAKLGEAMHRPAAFGDPDVAALQLLAPCSACSIISSAAIFADAPCCAAASGTRHGSGCRSW